MACGLENFARGPRSWLFHFFPYCLRGLHLSGMRNSEKKNSDVFGNQTLELHNNSKNGDGQYLDRCLVMDTDPYCGHSLSERSEGTADKLKAAWALQKNVSSRR